MARTAFISTSLLLSTAISAEVDRFALGVMEHPYSPFRAMLNGLDGHPEGTKRKGVMDWIVMQDPDGNEFCVLAPQ